MNRVADGLTPKLIRLVTATAILIGSGFALVPRSSALDVTLQNSAVLTSKTSKKVTVIVGSLRRDLTLFSSARSIAINVAHRGDRASVFLYTPGAGEDGLLEYWVDAGQIEVKFTRLDVSGRYQPFAFSEPGSDGFDSSIFWYAPGTSSDYIWHFQTDGTYSSRREHVDGTYRVIEWTARRPDGSSYVPGPGLVWYAPGSGRDVLWEWQPDGSHISVPLTINGDYHPVLGQWLLDGPEDGDDILWYNSKGSAYIWSAQYTNPSQPPLIKSYNVGVLGTTSRISAGHYLADPADNPGFEIATLLTYYPGTPVESYWHRDTAVGKYLMRRASAGSIIGDYRIASFGLNDVFLLGTGTEGKILHMTSNGPGTAVRLSSLPSAPVVVVQRLAVRM